MNGPDYPQCSFAQRPACVLERYSRFSSHDAFHNYMNTFHVVQNELMVTVTPV